MDPPFSVKETVDGPMDPGPSRAAIFDGSVYSRDIG